MIALESKEEAGRLEGVVAGDLEAIKEAARFDAERVGDDDVPALIGATRECDWQQQLLRLFLSNGGCSQEHDDDAHLLEHYLQ